MVVIFLAVQYHLQLLSLFCHIQMLWVHFYVDFKFKVFYSNSVSVSFDTIKKVIETLCNNSSLVKN